jgi:hypothetical protein
MKLVLIALAITLTGCAATKQPDLVWNHRGGTESFYEDVSECKSRSISMVGANLMRMMIQERLCLQGKGWWLEERR